MAGAKKKGKCRDCGSSCLAAARCGRCLSKNRDLYRRRAEFGLCVTCGDGSTAGAFCLNHWFKNIGSAHGLNQRNGGLNLLKELWDSQAGKCALTGKQLTPGVDASLDHILAVSRGGTSSKDNLRWVRLEVNRAKSDMSDEDFVKMCQDVAFHNAKPRTGSVVALAGRKE